MILDHLDPRRPLSLYLHIPFCRTKCGYCAFYSIGKDELLPADFTCYQQIFLSNVCSTLKAAGPFKTIFIGGGNPVMLGHDKIKALLEMATEKGMAEECTIEINPEDLDDRIDELMPYLTRISVGIQSFNDESLRTLERNATAEDNIRALNKLMSLREEHGIQFNGDLMTCIPGQSLKSAIEDVRELASYAPDHISLYALTFEEGTRLTEKSVPMDEDEQVEMLTTLWDELEKLGYEQYEISNFARNGAYCKHNLVYWNLGQYLGLGPSAESSLGYHTIASGRQGDDIGEYESQPGIDFIPLSKEEAEEELLLSCLRTKWGIDKAEFKTRFGEEFDKKFSPFIVRLPSDLYVNTPESFRLTRKGFLLSDRVILELAMAI